MPLKCACGRRRAVFFRCFGGSGLQRTDSAIRRHLIEAIKPPLQHKRAFTPERHQICTALRVLIRIDTLKPHDLSACGAHHPRNLRM
jgi:hypothetical protein